MYDLANRYNNTFDVMQYTVAAMREVGFSKDEIDDYIDEATKSTNANLIDVSTDYICKCNELSDAFSKASGYEATYSDFWESYSDDTYDDLNDEDKYDELTGELTYSSKWGRDYEHDDYDDDTDCYEGFNSCKRHYYWDTDDDLDF